MKIEEVRKNTHQSHIESLVFAGPEGLSEINNYIVDNLDQDTSTTNKTVKVDGAPALLIGHNVIGYPEHFVGIKSVLNSAENAYSSIEEIKAKKPNIADKMIYGLDLAKYIPDGEIWQGDVLFTKGEVKEQTINGKDYLVFQPNTIVYAFPETNPDYEKLKNADFGICFHTIYRGEEGDFSQSFKVDLSRINVPDNYFLLSPTIKVNRDKVNIDELKNIYNKLRNAESKLLADQAYEDLCENKLFKKYWEMFENHITSDQKATHIDKNSFIGNLKKFVDDKMKNEFDALYAKLKSEEGKDKAYQNYLTALEELQTLINSRKETLSNMVDCFNLVVDIKNIFISWLSDNPGYDTYLQSRSKGYVPSTGEGIALSDDEGNIVKLVNRAEFSNANRNSDIIKGFEHESLEEAELVENSRYNNVKKALFGDPLGKVRTFAIISADNPLNFENLDDEEAQERYRRWKASPVVYNKLSRKEMKDRLIDTGNRTLKYGNFNYTQLTGKYGDSEKSFMIYNTPFSDAKTIASNFGQESFFYGHTYFKGCKIAYYKATTDSCKNYKLVEISDQIENRNDVEDFFSSFGSKEKGIIFRIMMNEFGDDVKQIENENEFEESMRDDRPFSSRALHRKNAYEPSFVANMENKVQNSDKDPAVIATKRYHNMKTKKLKKGQAIANADGLIGGVGIAEELEEDFISSF